MNALDMALICTIQNKHDIKINILCRDMLLCVPVAVTLWLQGEATTGEGAGGERDPSYTT